MSPGKAPAIEVQKKTEPARQLEQEANRPPEQGPVQQVAPQAAYRRAQVDRNRLRPADLLALQRAVGNRVVQRVMRMPVSLVQQTNDPVVVKNSNSPQNSLDVEKPAEASIQRKTSTPGEEMTVTRWENKPEQRQFRDKVLEAAKAAKGRKPYSDLKQDELSKVPGASGVVVGTAAAAEAGRFLDASRMALTNERTQIEANRKVQAATKLTFKEQDILDTIDVKISGYRSVAEEDRLWAAYFRGYYNRTSKERRSMFKDPHGPAAIKWMARRIAGWKAPPGFSKHTLGLSIDFYQMRRITKRGKSVIEWLNNRTDEGSEPGKLRWWKQTWLYHWLHTNAKDFGFTELKTEPWHYDFVSEKELEKEQEYPVPKTGNVPHPKPV